MPASILAIGIDPARHTGLALVRLDVASGEATLVGVWPIYGDRWRSWCMRALGSAYSLSHDCDRRSDVVGWYERPAPARPGEATWDPSPMAMRAGAVLMALQVAGVADVLWQPINAAQWAAGARVPVGKRDGGEHRIIEASTRVIGAADALADIDHCQVDCAEAILIALACARSEAERQMGGQQMPLQNSSSSSDQSH